MIGIRPLGRFPAEQRLRKRREFERAQANGQRVATRHFVFLLCRSQNPTAAPCRLGITASRKVGSAVTRNRAKRLVREAFRATRELWPSAIEVVVIVRKPLAAATLSIVVAEWQKILPQLAEIARTLPAPTELTEHD